MQFYVITGIIFFFLRTRVFGKILYIIAGSLRGGIMSVGSFEFFFKIYQDEVHLMLSIGDFLKSAYERADSPYHVLLETAKYIQWVPEPQNVAKFDWANVLDNASAYNSKNNTPVDWKILCKLKDQWLGGVKRSGCGQIGSAGLLLGFRYYVYKYLIETQIFKKYDWIVLSRADHIFACPFYYFLNFNSSHRTIYAPEGEEYFGVTDRFLVGAPTFFMKMISITVDIFSDPDRWYHIMKFRSNWNLEQLIYFHLSQNNISVTFFPRLYFNTIL